MNRYFAELSHSKDLVETIPIVEHRKILDQQQRIHEEKMRTQQLEFWSKIREMESQHAYAIQKLNAKHDKELDETVEGHVKLMLDVDEVHKKEIEKYKTKPETKKRKIVLKSLKKDFL